MRRISTLFVYATIASTLAGCSEGDEDSDTTASSLATGPTGVSMTGQTGQTGQTGEPSETLGTSATTSSTSSDTGNSETGTTTATTSATTTTATTQGIKLDVGEAPDFGGNDTEEEPVVPTCDNIDTLTATSVGCEFWGAQVPSNASALPYGISVGNPSEELTAHIVIEDMRGEGGSLREIVSFDLPPKSSELTKINGNGGLLNEDHMLMAAGFHQHGSFRVRSDVPVTAMQLFPVGGGSSHVSEASLMLPVNALDTAYIGMGWKDISDNGGWVAVLALEDATTVTTNLGNTMLDAFDVQLYRPGSDASGFFVGADVPVAVYSGSQCTLIPGLPWYACDHLEEQLVPLSSWGNNYVAARHPHRVAQINPQPEEVYWRVIAAVENTTITLDPPVPGVGGSIDLASVGDHSDFPAVESFTAQSDNPFMLVQFMSGCYNVVKDSGNSGNCNQGPTGDPYMIQIPPVEQWLTSLPFLTDTSYPRDYVTIMREAGTEVTLDCLGVVSDDHFTAIPGTTYEYGHVTLDMDGQGGEGNCSDGEQFIHANGPIGILVMGLDWATSYGYPGGLNLKGLWVPPQEPPG
ncbi:MAG: IgGFc-binding protein [Nannocystaceae bacterium]